MSKLSYATVTCFTTALVGSAGAGELPATFNFQDVTAVQVNQTVAEATNNEKVLEVLARNG